MSIRRTALAVVAVFLTCTLIVVPCGELSAESGFDIEDGIGRTVSFSEPAEHVVSIGKGTTATVIELGYLDGIVVVDKYSNDKTEPVFKELNQLVEEGKVKAGGTPYKSGVEQLKKDILDSADPKQGGTFDKTKDVVLITVSKSNADPLLEYLTDKGFQRILVWYDITEYDDIIDFVDKVSMSLSGEKSGLAEQMRYVSDTVKDKVKSTGTAVKKAFFVTYSGDTYKVGNTGSIATSLITAAAGDAYSVDPSKKGTTYETSIPELYEKGDNPIVFADKSIWSAADKLNKLSTMVPGAQIVKVEPLWNNFCPDSMDGVWAMACAMYPQLFEGDVPTVPEPEGDNLLVYAAIGIAAVVLICAGAYFFMRKESS